MQRCHIRGSIFGPMRSGLVRRKILSDQSRALNRAIRLGTFESSRAGLARNRCPSPVFRTRAICAAESLLSRLETPGIGWIVSRIRVGLPVGSFCLTLVRCCNRHPAFSHVYRNGDEILKIQIWDSIQFSCILADRDRCKFFSWRSLGKRCEIFTFLQHFSAEIGAKV